MCEYRLPIGKYHAVRHITCAEGANIDLLEYPLIHRRRDGGPPSPQSSAKPSGRRLVLRQSCRGGCCFPTKLGKAERAKVGVCGESCRATAVRPTPSSRQRRATFPAIGKVYPTKLGKAERAKVALINL